MTNSSDRAEGRVGVAGRRHALKYVLYNPTYRGNFVYVTTDAKVNKIHNELTLSITNTSNKDITLENTAGIDDASQVPPISARRGVPGFACIYAYFVWAKNSDSSTTNALCTLESATKIIPSPGPNNHDWMCLTPQPDPEIGTYWVLSPKKNNKVILKARQQVAFVLSNIVSEVQPGDPFLYIKANIPRQPKRTWTPTHTTTVPPDVSIESFEAKGGLQIDYGASVALYWNTRSASYCTVNNTQTAAQMPKTGSGYTVTPFVSANSGSTFVLVAFDQDSGFSSKPWPLQFTLNPVSVGPLTATPSTCKPGDTVQLSWTGLRSAKSAEIDGGESPIPVNPSQPSGTTTVKPSKTTTYVLSATGALSHHPPATSKATVTVS